MSDGQAAFGVFFEEDRRMPKTTGQSLFFTAITAWIMVYIMTVYNTVLARLIFRSIFCRKQEQ